MSTHFGLLYSTCLVNVNKVLVDETHTKQAHVNAGPQKMAWKSIQKVARLGHYTVWQ